MSVHLFNLLLHLHDGASHYVHVQGVNFTSAQSALTEGRAAAWSLMQSLSKHVDDWSGWRVEVVDSTGHTIVVLPFLLIPSTSRHPRDANSRGTRAWG